MEIKKIDRQSIINKLKQKGYSGKLIFYKELQELYKQYGNGMIESDFAQAILGVSYGNYSSCKYNGKRVRIIKEIETELPQEEIQKIIELLKQEGYIEKSITYQQLQGLHRQYGKGMTERDFAQKVLGVSYANYGACKNRGTRVKILKKQKRELTQNKIQEIIEKLKKNGYKGKLITYEELQELHKKYGSGLTESEFAQTILGISQGNYYTCKNRGTRVRILKDKEIELSTVEIEKVIETLKKKGYTGKRITYAQLQELHKEYGKGMVERDFAQKILGISYSTYSKCKCGVIEEITVLTEKNLTWNMEDVQKIIEELKREGYKGKSVTYEELKEIHKKYGNGMTESVFVQIVLGISHGNYDSCKNKGTRVRLFKDKNIELSFDEIQKTIEILKEEGYTGKRITYAELQELHKKYGNGMTESVFAEKILGISQSTYKRCKNAQTKRVAILKSQKENLSPDEIQKIIEELNLKGYKGKDITYEELQKLHREYGKGLTEKDFAQKILGISEEKYYSCKKNGSTVKILKDKKRELPKDEVQKLIENLKQKGYMGKSITYEEFQELHGEYGNGMREMNFAQTILGISYSSYGRLKYKGLNAIIKDSIVDEKAKEIRELYVNKPGFYSKEFITNLCKEYDISLEDFIIYVVIKGFCEIDHVLEAFEKNEGLWIGKIRVSEEFANRNIDLIRKVASRIVNILWHQYIKRGDKQDYIQDAILYILENMGGEERNFGYDLEKFEHVIYVRTKKYCKGSMVQDFKATSKLKSFTRSTIKKGAEETVEIQIADKSVNVEQQVIQNETASSFIEESERCIKVLSKYIEDGFSRDEAIAMTAEEMDIDASTMLEYMKCYLVTKGKVKFTKVGAVEWDDRS